MNTEHESGTSDVRTQLISVVIGVAARFLYTVAAKGVELAVETFKKRHSAEAPQNLAAIPVKPAAVQLAPVPEEQVSEASNP